MRRPIIKSVKPMNQSEKADCYRSVLRGKSVKTFYASEFWKNHLEPFLNETRKGILAENHFRVGTDLPSIERIALLNAFNGGRIHLLDTINDQLSQWSNLAAHAEQKIELEQERENKK